MLGRTIPEKLLKLGVLLGLLALSQVAACATDAERRGDHLQRADEFFGAGKYREAEIEYRNALQIDPKSAEAHYKLGKTYLVMKDLRGAFVEFRRAVDLDPNLRSARLELARMYLASGDGVKSEAEARAMLERDPKDVDAYLLLTTWFLLDQKIVDAEEAMKQALALEPDSADVQLTYARVLLTQGKYDEAQAAIERSIQINPKSAEAHLTLASYFRLRGKPDDAIKALQSAITVAPGDALPRFRLAELYLTQQKHEATLALLSEMVQNGPEKEAAKRRLADLYLELDRLDEAEKAIVELEQIEKGNLETRYLRARLRLLNGDIPGGSEELERVLKEWPSLVQARYQLAVARTRENKLDQAAAELTECLRYQPDFIEARALLAKIHLNNRAYDLAEEEARKVLTAAPGNYQMRILLSDAALAQGNFGAARTAAQSAVNDFPNQAGGYHRLGRALSNLGEQQQAIQMLERALTLNPDALDVLNDLIVVMGKLQRPLADRIARTRTHSEAHPENGGAKLLLAQLQLQEDRAQGMRTLEQAIQAHPDLLPAYYLLGAAYTQEGRLDDARSRFSELIAKNENVVPAHMMLGILSDVQGDHNAAAEHYKRAIDLQADFAPAANNLAWHYAEREGKLDLALELARRAKAKLPEDPNVADTLGWILYRRGLYAAAIEHLKFSADKMPKNADVRYHLGMAYLRNGDKEKARAELTAALAIGPFEGRKEAERALAEVG